MKEKPVVILGGGVSGLAAALTLLESGKKVIIIEKGDRLGGAARSINIPENRTISAGYHQVVGTDLELIRFLKKLNLLDRLSWKSTKITSLVGTKEIDLSSPIDILLFKHLSILGRIRYLLFGARCVLFRNWQPWEGKSVTEMVRKLAGEEVLEKIFQPLVDIKFGISTDLADAAWLGKRLSHREAATRFGYLPNGCWTQEMCDAFERRILELGGVIKTQTGVKKIDLNSNKQVVSVVTDKEEKIPVKAIVSTLPPPILTTILKNGKTPKGWVSRLEKIKYIHIYSLVAGLPFEPFKNYWTIFLHPRKTFGGCFTISNLNDTLCTKKDKAVINVFTNSSSPKPKWTPEEYERNALVDLQDVLGTKVKPNWVKTTLIFGSSPIFGVGFKNLPDHLGPNFYLAGIYRTYPKFSSTGEAMANGEEVALTLLKHLSNS
jgi:protoporphyrinogen oxidase